MTGGACTERDTVAAEGHMAAPPGPVDCCGDNGPTQLGLARWTVRRTMSAWPCCCLLQCLGCARRAG